MKQLKSTANDLRRLFDHAIAIREIAEPLASFDADQDSTFIANFMDAHHFDVVGVREDGFVVGYLRRQSLKSGQGRNCFTPFRPHDVLAENAPMSVAFRSLQDRNEMFISLLGRVGAIVTRGDLQKTPVRLWLFGLVSLLEMQMLRLVRARFPDNQWTGLLSLGRLREAQTLFDERKRRNEEVQLSDCLQLCDKATILQRDPELSALLTFPTRSAGQKFFSQMESFRNDLAHANDILKGRWPQFAELVSQCEQLLIRLESYHTKQAPQTMLPH